MKRILFLSAFVSTLVYCQQGNANVNNSPVTRETLIARAGYVNPLETKGSPYLYAEYKKARIANNQKLVDMRYNAYKDEVDIINNGKNMTIYKNPEYSPIHIIDSDEILYLLEYPYNGKDSVKLPRPTKISARPSEIKSKVAKSSYTFTGSEELKTVTPLANLMFLVMLATAARTISGDETA